jgi:hypothetical protein
MNCFAKGEAIARQTFTVNSESERRGGDHQNIQRKGALQISLPDQPTVGVFCTGKIQAGQDRAF